MAEAQTGASSRAPLGLIALNLGGPGSLDDVRPFLQRLFNDPEVLQIRWSPLRKFVAWSIAPSVGSDLLNEPGRGRVVKCHQVVLLPLA